VSVNSAGQSPEARTWAMSSFTPRVREQRVPRGAGGARPLVLRGAQQAKAQLKLVAGQVARAGQLRKPPLTEPALRVEFRQPELRVHVTHRDE